MPQYNNRTNFVLNRGDFEMTRLLNAVITSALRSKRTSSSASLSAVCMARTILNIIVPN